MDLIKGIKLTCQTKAEPSWLLTCKKRVDHCTKTVVVENKFRHSFSLLLIKGQCLEGSLQHFIAVQYIGETLFPVLAIKTKSTSSNVLRRYFSDEQIKILTKYHAECKGYERGNG